MTWREELGNNVRTVEDLLPHLPMDETTQARMAEILERFPMSVTPYYLSLINWEDADDPIRKMAIPSPQEVDMSGSFDTSGEADNTVVPGLQHKYPETALMLSTSECAMYCRHCFRKRLVGMGDEEIAKNFGAMRDYIMAHGEIANVLVSGGDALLCSDERLCRILDMLCEVPHLDLIRICTRTPVVFPSRIDAALLDILRRYSKKKQLVLVTQFNHPRELTQEAAAAVETLRLCGIPVRNQTVLLRGVNGDAAVLGRLLRGLTAIGAHPYYVFQCRPVSGVKSRFQLPLREGYAVVEAAKAMQNGIGKGFRFCLSQHYGKMEILGVYDDEQMIFKYHETKDPERYGQVFLRPVAKGQTWIEE